jgi:serine/threonine-protein kinase HipA
MSSGHRQEHLCQPASQLTRLDLWRALLAGEKGIRLSLAGAQDKIAVRIEGGEISLPLGGAPSTHILKPGIDRFPGVVFNEALTMTLAAAIGLPAAKVQTRNSEGIDDLLVERYDRIHRPAAEGGGLERLHQEDFCQAQNIVPDIKYQREGGPSLKACFGLLRGASSAPVIDLARLLDAVIFNYLVGNNDAHGKNFSLLYHAVGTPHLETRLAPLYDVVSTVYYPELSDEMAMKIGTQYSSERVTPRDFDRFADQAGLAKPLVRQRVLAMAEANLAALDKTRAEIAQPAADAVAELLRKRGEKVTEAFRK